MISIRVPNNNEDFFSHKVCIQTKTGIKSHPFLPVLHINICQDAGPVTAAVLFMFPTAYQEAQLLKCLSDCGYSQRYVSKMNYSSVTIETPDGN